MEAASGLPMDRSWKERASLRQPRTDESHEKSLIWGMREGLWFRYYPGVANRPGEEYVMKAPYKVLLVTVLIAAPAMVLGPVIWPPAEGGPEPTGDQLPFFIFLALMESVLLGLGISFLLFGLPVVRAVSPDSRARAWAMYLSIGWLMVSWWPHDNLHIHNGMDMQGLLYIEYGFHFTLMIAALVLAYCFLSLIRQRSEVATPPATARVK
jgi:hypothetical protein